MLNDYKRGECILEDISRNIKRVLVVFLLLFVALISYLSYFVIMEGPKIVNKPLNKRLWAKRNEVLRGTIYDRNLKALTKSERIDKLSQRREYVGGELFAHVLGYVDQRYGLTGLEYNYDSELMANNNPGFFDFLKIGEKDIDKVGNGLGLTIDYDTEKAASDLMGNNRGAVVAIDPSNGQIIAMVSKPDFNPNKLSETWDKINKDEGRPLLNRAVSGLYAPGSTFKTITAISALENIKDINSRVFKDEGKYVFNPKESLQNYGGEVLGNISFKDSYVHSSNVVFGTLGIELGNTKLLDTAEKFYFNKNIPADGLIIDNSRFPKFKSNEKGNIAQSAIGQSAVLSTPMQMALVAATIANDGVMMEPMLVNEVLSAKGDRLKKIQPKVIGTVTSKENAALVKDFMRGVVTNGTGGNASVSGISVAGKTGTADHDDKPNVDEPPHSWFIGFAPYENPKIAVAVIVEEGGVGGGAAAKISSGVIRAYLKK
jgi:penicillin-binding protein A